MRRRIVLIAAAAAVLIAVLWVVLAIRARRAALEYSGTIETRETLPRVDKERNALTRKCPIPWQGCRNKRPVLLGCRDRYERPRRVLQK